MQQSIAHIALVVRDYDEALDFYVGKLGFCLVEDSYQPEQDKRWVVVSPPGSSGTSPASRNSQCNFSDSRNAAHSTGAGFGCGNLAKLA